PEPPPAEASKTFEPASKTGDPGERVRIEAPRASLGVAPPAILVSAITRKPLGVRLSILKTAQDGQTTEVAPDTSFQPVDRVRLNIQVSDSGYLYIINRGSSGTWTSLFPSAEAPNASNAVSPGATYTVPPDRNFVISDPPGEEKLFIILSRNPVMDAESL